MKRRKFVTMLTLSAILMTSSMTAFAAPRTMPDGEVFDAEYYAESNPDVVAALGTDENVLYQHYQNCGKAEGRLAVAPGSAGIEAQTESAPAANELMENVYNMVINISTDTLGDVHEYVAANLENIKNSCTFIESKGCPTEYDGTPVYTTSYYTYVAKDGQRLNMMVTTEDMHIYSEPVKSSASPVYVEFLIDSEIVDSTRPSIELKTRERTYEHYIKWDNIYGYSPRNLFINNGKYCTYRGSLRNYMIFEEEDMKYYTNSYSNLANKYVNIHIMLQNIDPKYENTLVWK